MNSCPVRLGLLLLWIFWKVHPSVNYNVGFNSDSHRRKLYPVADVVGMTWWQKKIFKKNQFPVKQQRSTSLWSNNAMSIVSSLFGGPWKKTRACIPILIYTDLILFLLTHHATHGVTKSTQLDQTEAGKFNRTPFNSSDHKIWYF